MAYLRYLENEIVTYVSLTQSKSHLVKGVAKRMIQVSGKPSSFIFHCMEVFFNPKIKLFAPLDEFSVIHFVSFNYFLR